MYSLKLVEIQVLNTDIDVCLREHLLNDDDLFFYCGLLD